MDSSAPQESTFQLSRCNSIISDDSYDASSLASICPVTPASGGLSPIHGTIAPNVLSRGMVSDFLPIEQDDQDVMSLFDHRTHCFPCIPSFHSEIMKEEPEEGYFPSALASPTSSIGHTESTGIAELSPSFPWCLTSSLSSLRTDDNSLSPSAHRPQTAATTTAAMALNLVTPKDEHEDDGSFFQQQLALLDQQNRKRLYLAKKEVRRRSSAAKKSSTAEGEKFPIVVTEMEKTHRCHFQNCSARFKRQEHLRRHEKTHTGEKPHICHVPACLRQFSRSDNLNAHLKTHTKRGGRNKFIEGLSVTVVRKSRHITMRPPM